MVIGKQRKQDELIKGILDLIKSKGWTAHCDEEDISEITQIHVAEDKNDYCSTIINIKHYCFIK